MNQIKKVNNCKNLRQLSATHRVHMNGESQSSYSTKLFLFIPYSLFLEAFTTFIIFDVIIFHTLFIIFIFLLKIKKR